MKAPELELDEVPELAQAMALMKVLKALEWQKSPRIHSPFR